MNKFRQFVRNISSATKLTGWSFSSATTKDMMNVAAHANFDRLASTDEFIALKNAISNLPAGTLFSRALCIDKLHYELIGLTSLSHADLLDAFICLSRRYFLFAQIDRILPVLQKHPLNFALGFDITCVYFYLGTDAYAHEYFGYAHGKNSQKYLFEITTREYFLEILSTLALHNLQAIFSKMDEADKFHYYKDWHLKEEFNRNKLYHQRKDYFLQALRQVEVELGQPLAGIYESALLRVMHRDATKKLLHEGLYLLEVRIQTLCIPPEEYARAQAVGYLHKTTQLLLEKPVKLDDVCCSLLFEYTHFNKLDDLVKRVSNIIKGYQGPRKLDQVKLAIDQAYLSFAQNGDYHVARDNLVDELALLRRATYVDHKTNGLGCWFGMFQTQSRLVTDLDCAIKLVDEDMTAEVAVKLTPGQ
jgi:hypothetical protein